MRPLARNGLTALGVALGYYVCAAIGTLLGSPSAAFAPSALAPAWPATAFLISVLLILPVNRWWLCAVAVIPAHYLAGALLPAVPLAVVTAQLAGTLLLAAVTTIAVRRTMARHLLFDSFGSVLGFILIAGVAVPAMINTIVLGACLATGWASNFWLPWWQWMLAGAFPTITIAPLLVLAFERRLTGSPPASPRAGVELALLAPLIFGVSFLAFGGSVDAAHWPVLLLTPFPLLLWAAVRLGVGGTSASLLVVAIATADQALRHNGPFAAQAPIDGLLSLQAFLVTGAIPLMLLAALTDERRRAAALLRQADARMQVAASSTDTALWQWDERAQQLWLTENCRAIFDLTADATCTPYAFLDMVHPDDRLRVGAALEAALTQSEARSPIEFRLYSRGVTRWFLLHTRTDLDDMGTPIRVSGVFRDVSDRAEAQRAAERLRRRLAFLQDGERRRIAEELHESTAQHLIAASLNLINLKARGSREIQELADEILQSVNEAATEIRTFSYLLHPPQLEKESLSSVLRKYVPGFERRTGVRTTLRITPLADQLPPDQQHAILRIAQESLGNVHRHARATRASVSVRCISGNVHLVVHDDGKGIGAEAGEQLGDRLRLGIGIPAMTARVRQMGGRVDMGAGARGTTIHVVLPLHSPAEAGGRSTAEGARLANGLGRVSVG